MAGDNLHLVDEVPQMPNTDFANLFTDRLIRALRGLPVENQAQGERRLEPGMVHLIRFQRNSIACLAMAVSLFTAYVAFIVLSANKNAALQNASDPNDASALKAQRNAYIAAGSIDLLLSVLSLCFSICLWRRAQPNIIELNAQPQNVHAEPVTSGHIAVFNALKPVIANPIDLASVKQHMLAIFSYRCEQESEFKNEMIALYRPDPQNPDLRLTDLQKLQSVKLRIKTAVDFMTAGNQANRSPIGYPHTIKTSEVLSYIWTCVEKLSLHGCEVESRLLCENVMKALYAACGHCNTGHVSRVLQAFGESIQSSFNIETVNQSRVQITPQDFYTSNRNDILQLIKKVVDSETIREHLHALEQTYGEDRQTYTDKATLVVKNEFALKLQRYVSENHPQALPGNQNFSDDLMQYFSAAGTFPILIDTALESSQSIASFAHYPPV